jgi:hypothetical protein
MGMAAVNTAMQAKIQKTLCSFIIHPPLPLETPERASLIQSISTTCYRARNCQFRQSARSIAGQLPRGCSRIDLRRVDPYGKEKKGPPPTGACQFPLAHKQRLGHISKQGSSLLRFLLVEVAQAAVRNHPDWRRRYT